MGYEGAVWDMREQCGTGGSSTGRGSAGQEGAVQDGAVLDGHICVPMEEEVMRKEFGVC
jgi:hypothetical protein